MKLIFSLFFIISTISLKADEKINFELIKDTAQYKGSDYLNVVHVERGISLEEAFKIAAANPEIDYFVYTKGSQMILEISSDFAFNQSDDPFHLISFLNFFSNSGELKLGYCRIFRQGDTLFFKKEKMWLGSAPELADTYIKVRNVPPELQPKFDLNCEKEWGMVYPNLQILGCGDDARTRLGKYNNPELLSAFDQLVNVLTAARYSNTHERLRNSVAFNTIYHVLQLAEEKQGNISESIREIAVLVSQGEISLDRILVPLYN